MTILIGQYYNEINKLAKDFVVYMAYFYLL